MNINRILLLEHKIVLLINNNQFLFSMAVCFCRALEFCRFGLTSRPFSITRVLQIVVLIKKCVFYIKV